jgi:hypothetical protein
LTVHNGVMMIVNVRYMILLTLDPEMFWILNVTF